MDQSRSITNNQGWSLTVTFRPENPKVRLTSPKGAVIKNPILIQAKDRFADFDAFQKEFNRLSQSKITFGFQVHKKKDRTVVVFDRYGLAGGVHKELGQIIGLAQAAFGVYLIIKKPEIKPIGTMLVTSGVSSIYYAYKIEEDQFNYWKPVQTLITHAGTIMLSRTISKVNPLNEQRVIKPLIDSTANTVVIEGVQIIFKAIKEKKMPSIMRAINQLGYPTLGSLLASTVSLGYKAISKSLKGGEKIASVFLRGLIIDGIDGGLITAINKIFRNKYLNKVDDRKAWNHGLKGAMAQGALSSALCGAADEISKFNERNDLGTENYLKGLEENLKEYVKELVTTRQNKGEVLSKEWTIWLEAVRKFEKFQSKHWFGFRTPAQSNLLSSKETLLKSNIEKAAVKIIVNNGLASDPNVSHLQTQIIRTLCRFHVFGGSYDATTAIENQPRMRLGMYNLNQWLNRYEPVISTINKIAASQLTELLAYMPNEITIKEVASEDWQELVKHIVLVTGIKPDTLGYFPEADLDNHDPCYQAACLVKYGITKDGQYGNHLNFGDNLYQGNLVDRPHLSWVWNQLVQPHARGSWENSSIAILEPLSAFEGSEKEKVLSVTPYDAFTIGSHRLSAQSIVLVPQGAEEEAKNHFKDGGFEGKVRGFQGEIRKAIFNELKQNFPDVWHVIDPKTGQLTAPVIRFTPAGYLPDTCLQRTDGSYLFILRNNDDIVAPALKEVKEQGRFIDLHTNCTTAWLEDKPIFDELKHFRQDRTFLRNPNSNFAGYATENHANLAILQAWEFSQKMHSFARVTRAWEVGDYVFKEMLYADLSSVFFKEFPEKQLDFTTYEISLMISTNEWQARYLLKQFALNEKEEDAFENYFKPYQEMLSKIVQSMEEARVGVKEELDAAVEYDELAQVEERIQEELAEEWKTVCEEAKNLPPMSERWPLKTGERAFLSKVRNYVLDSPAQLASILKAATTLLFEPDEQERERRLSYLSYSLELRLKEIYYLGVQATLLESLNFPYSLRIIDRTLAIGNCLFDNIAAQIYPQAEDDADLSVGSSNLRSECVSYMRTHQEEFAPYFLPYGELPIENGQQRHWYSTWDEYLDALAQDRVWADEPVLRAISLLLQRPLVRFAFGQQLPAVYYGESEKEPLFIAHLGEVHFASLVPSGELTGQQILQEVRVANVSAAVPVINE